jgi:hypothetical protein
MTIAEVDQEITNLFDTMRQAGDVHRRALAHLDAVPTLTDNPEARASLEQERLAALRAAEDEMLATTAAATARARALNRLLSVDVGVKLTPDQWTKAAAMRGFIGDQVASAGAADLARLLEGAQLSDDPALAYTTARAVDARLRAGAIDALRAGPADDAVSISRVQDRIREIDASLRSAAADPVRTRVEEVATAAETRERAIEQMRANRGEGSTLFRNPRWKGVPYQDPFTTPPTYDIAGRPIAG